MKLFAALREDTHQGWVWLMDSSLPPRSIIKITNPDNGKTAYCEAVQIDKNFLAIYNELPRIKITDQQSALVIGNWYRATLGGLSTQEDVPLVVTPSNNCWGHFMACIHHPQTVVRVAAWLGLISVVLGLLGVFLGGVSLVGAANIRGGMGSLDI